jgi:hypothetical protein
MIAYYYHDERFDGVSECGISDDTADSTNQDTQDEEIDDSNSDSFFEEIFKNFKK